MQNVDPSSKARLLAKINYRLIFYKIVNVFSGDFFITNHFLSRRLGPQERVHSLLHLKIFDFSVFLIVCGNFRE